MGSLSDVKEPTLRWLVCLGRLEFVCCDQQQRNDAVLKAYEFVIEKCLSEHEATSRSAVILFFSCHKRIMGFRL